MPGSLCRLGPFLRRHLLRIRLRTVLLLIAVVALPVAWLSDQARRQRDAVAALSRYDFSYGGVSEQPLIRSIQVCVAKLLGNDFAFRVVEVFLAVDWGDVDLDVLGDLPHIESVYVGGHTLNGPMLAKIVHHLPKLHTLEISDKGRLTAADMLCLRRSPQLKHLGLDVATDVAAEELLPSIAELDQLRSLKLKCPRMTATMVRQLTNTMQLEEIEICATEEKSAAEVGRLQNALPYCQVIEDGPRP